MLLQASLSQVKAGQLPRQKSHIVITMRYYPRFLKKELRDEYISDLAPDKDLLRDFNEALKKYHDHVLAFKKVAYPRRFCLKPEAFVQLERLAVLSKEKDVYLVCMCELGEPCHRELLLLMAKQRYKAPIGKIYHRYPGFKVS